MIEQVWRFIDKIKQGDLVALSLKSEPSIAVGEVISAYEYREYTPNIKHTRRVKWLETIPRSEFDQDILNSLGSPKTVTKVRSNTAESHVKRILQNRGVLLFGDSTTENTNVIRNLTQEEVILIINEFRKWYKSQSGQKQFDIIEREKQEVKVIMKRLDTMDKNSIEFVDLVLYGLLPHFKIKYAKRVSTFPVFLNVKQLFENIL